jgi:hypothetical protein
MPTASAKPETPHMPDVRAYVSDHVYDGTRPLSAASVDQLRSTYRSAYEDIRLPFWLTVRRRINQWLGRPGG